MSILGTGNKDHNTYKKKHSMTRLGELGNNYILILRRDHYCRLIVFIDSIFLPKNPGKLKKSTTLKKI